MAELKVRKDTSRAWEKIETKRENVRIKPMWEYSAHRGYYSDGGVAENSLGSLLRAKEKGFGYSECDVRFTSDNVPVICHNATVGGYTIADETAETITSVAIGTMPRLGTLYVPTLEQYLKLASYIDMKLVIHFGSATVSTAAIVAKLVHKYAMQDRVVYMTGDIATLTVFAESYKNARVHLCAVSGAQIPSDLSAYKALTSKCAYVGFNINALTVGDYAQQIENAFANGLEISYWNVDASNYSACMNTCPKFLTLANNSNIESGWNETYIASLNLW